MRSISMTMVTACLAWSCASTQPPAASSPTPGTTQQAFSKRFALVGADGVLVEVVDLQGDEALIRVSGVESPLQGKVVSHRRAKEQDDLRYTTQWSGREWLTLLRSGQSSWVGKYWQLNLQGEQAIPVAYSEERSEKVDVDGMFAAHEEQRRAGTLDELQRFNQYSERGQEDEEVNISASAASRECDSPVKGAIAWDTVTDQALRENNVSDYCKIALRALNSACTSSPEAKSFVREKVKEVSCRFDGTGQMTLDAGRLTWSMNFGLGDLDTLAGRALTELYLPE